MREGIESPASLESRARDLDRAISEIDAQLRAARTLGEDLRGRLAQACEKTRDRLDVQRVLYFLSSQINQPSGDLTARLITPALQSVIFDEDLTLVTEHTVRHGKPAVSVKIHDRKRGVVVDPMDACGGGPRYLVGILLRVISIVRQPQLRRFLVLDEPLKEISRRYHRKAVQLLRQICEPPEKNGLGFTILVVTHDPSLIEAAHRSYHALLDDDGVSLRLIENDPSPALSDREVDE